MAHLVRNTPHTPLDTLRVLLAEFAVEDTSFQGRLANLLQQYRKQLLRELGARIGQTTTPKGVRRAILAQVPRFDWPEWTPYILQALQQEADLGVFDEGCVALGAIATREAFEALKQLQAVRNDPDRQVILAREMGNFVAQQPASYYISRLMEGQVNPKLSSQGAKILSVTATSEDLPALIDAHRHGDEFTQRLTLRILASLPDSNATSYFLSILETARTDYTDLQQLLEIHRRIHTLQRGSAKPELLKLVKDRFHTRVSGIEDCLERISAVEGIEIGTELDALKAVAKGTCDHFLLDALALQVEGKYARYAAFLSETSDASESKILRRTVLADQAAEGLAYRADLKLASFQDLLPDFMETLRSRVGGEDFIFAFLRHLPATETLVLDELLSDPDLVRRQRYLNALGSREDDALVPFFLKAMQDAIVDVGLLAIHQLGKLPSSFPALMALFESGQREQVRLAIRVFGENQIRAAAEPLLDFVQKDSGDQLMVEAVEALANLRYSGGAQILLEMLHDGKPLNLQIALARALSLMATPEASLGLLQKASSLKQSQVLILCLEGALAAFPAFDHPLPVEQVPALIQLTERCCDEREGEGQRLRAMLALEHFYAFDKEAYEKLKDRFSDFLFNMRTKETWDRENNDKVAAVIKELTRRFTSLGLIAKKEAAIKAQLQGLPPAGPKRVEVLLALREALLDPELIIRPEFGKELADVVGQELQRASAEWREVAHLCEIGGLTHQLELVEPIRDVYQRATGLGLKSAARAALLRLGLSETDLNRRPPIHRILVLEPSAFFRKRLMASLASASTWTILEASSRVEAEALMHDVPVDLVLAESHDAHGYLGPWLDLQWQQRRFRNAILSTANRDLGEYADAAWMLGILFKPYPMEQLLRALES